jgi:hypothetical protein
VVVVPLNLLHREFGLAAELTHQFFTVLLPDRLAVVAIVGLILGDFLKAIAGEVKTGVALVAVEDLVGVIVEAAEAYFAISLKKFEVGAVFTLGRFDQFLVVNKLL